MQEITGKIMNYLSNEIWYHATTLDNLESLMNGIDCTYNMGTELDFGAGFYITNDLKGACTFINRILQYTQEGESEYLVDSSKKTGIVIEFTPICFYEYFSNGTTNAEIFSSYDARFAEFVFLNRIEPEKIKHEFDIIFGVQSDSLPTELILKYKDDIISKEEVLRGFEKGTSFKQLSIHNQEICNKLVVNKIYDSSTGEEIG